MILDIKSVSGLLISEKEEKKNIYECSDKGGGMYKIAEGSYEHVAKGFEVKIYSYTLFSFTFWRRGKIENTEVDTI